MNDRQILSSAFALARAAGRMEQLSHLERDEHVKFQVQQGCMRIWDQIQALSLKFNVTDEEAFEEALNLLLALGKAIGENGATSRVDEYLDAERGVLATLQA